MLQTLFPAFPGGRTGFALFLLRLLVGIAFMLHGYPKITNIAGFSEGVGVPVWLGTIAALTEFAGGGLLILGLITPLVNIFLVIQMLTAIFKVHVPKGDPFIGGWELAAVYLIANLAFLLTGPGAYSLDAMIFKRKT